MDDQLDFGLAAPADLVERAPSTARRPRRRRPRAGSIPQLALPLAQLPEPPRPTLRGKVRIEAIVRRELGPKVMVKLTANRSTMISCTRKSGVLYLRLHAIFAEAPEEVVVSAARYVSGERTTVRDNELIDEWIERHRHFVKKPAQDFVVQPHGEVHDLAAMFDALNEEYFDRRIAAQITWSRSLRNQRRRSMRLGSYCEEAKLIRIHPALDQDFVPAYFVASVVFHEMLHEVHGAPEHENGRREVHTPAFNEDERRFHDYERARRWEAKHLSRLLRY